MSRLEELPGSDDKFWQGAKKALIQPEAVNCRHFFDRKLGNKAECRKCHIGFFLGPKWKVVKGEVLETKHVA